MKKHVKLIAIATTLAICFSAEAAPPVAASMGNITYNFQSQDFPVYIRNSVGIAFTTDDNDPAVFDSQRSATSFYNFHLYFNGVEMPGSFQFSGLETNDGILVANNKAFGNDFRAFNETTGAEFIVRSLKLADESSVISFTPDGSDAKKVTERFGAWYAYTVMDPVIYPESNGPMPGNYPPNGPSNPYSPNGPTSPYSPTGPTSPYSPTGPTNPYSPPAPSTIPVITPQPVPEPVVAAVPEPETYAMMLAGLGALGFVARRRKNSLN